MKRRECINGITKVHSEVLLVNPKQIDSNWCLNKDNKITELQQKFGNKQRERKQFFLR